MSRREKSDAQLNAEAERRKVVWAGKPLTQWRVAYAAEPPNRLAAQHPPEMTEVLDGVHFRVIDPGAGVGVSMNGSFVRYLDGSGGKQFPAHDALLGWDRICRSKHMRWPDHRGRPVCAELAWAVVRGSPPLPSVIEQTEVSPERAERLLGLAFEWMARAHERWTSRIEASAPHDRDMCDVCRAADEYAA